MDTVEAAHGAGESEPPQPGQVELHPFPLTGDIVPIGLQVVDLQCVGRGPGTGHPEFGQRGVQRQAHDLFEIPQCLVAVEEHGFDHETRTTLPSFPPAVKWS